jgi:hypothetical protein
MAEDVQNLDRPEQHRQKHSERGRDENVEGNDDVGEDGSESGDDHKVKKKKAKGKRIGILSPFAL